MCDEYQNLLSWADPEGEETWGPDPPPPPDKSKNIGFLSNTGLNPLKITKLSSQHFMLGHHWTSTNKD